MVDIRVRKKGEKEFRKVQTDPSRRTKISTAGRGSRVVVSTKSGRGVTPGGAIIIDPKARTKSIQRVVEAKERETISGGMSTTPQLQRQGRLQTLASREDLERGARQNLLLTRQDFESAFQSSLQPRNGGTIILPDTAREARIRESNRLNDFESQLAAKTFVKEREVGRQKGLQESFLREPSFGGLIDIRKSELSVAKATLGRSQLVLRGGLELEQRGIVSLSEGVFAGETKLGPKIQLGIQQFKAGRDILLEDPLTTFGTVTFETGLLSGVVGGIAKGGRVSQTFFVPDKIPKTLVTTEGLTTTTKTVGRGEIVGTQFQTIFGRSGALGGELVPLGRVSTKAATITTEGIAVGDIARGGQILETANIESTTTLQLKGQSPRIIQTSFGKQRGSIIDEVLFERTIAGGTRAVTFLEQESTVLGGGRELFKVRGQTITGRGERTGFLFQEKELITDVGSRRVSIGESRTIQFEKGSRSIKFPKIGLGKRGQVGVSSIPEAIPQPSFLIESPTISKAVGKPQFLSGGALGRSVGLEDALLGFRVGGLTRGAGLARIGFGTGVQQGLFASPSPIGQATVLPGVSPKITGISLPSSFPTTFADTTGFTGSASAFDSALSKSVGRPTRAARIPPLRLEPIPFALPPIGFSLGGGGGGGFRPPKARKKGRIKTGSPPSLVGAKLGIGIKAKPGQEFSGLEVRQ